MGAEALASGAEMGRNRSSSNQKDRAFRVGVQLRALWLWLFVALSLVICPATSWAANPAEDTDEGGETAICTDFAESMSARPPLLHLERTTLSPCDDATFGWGQLPSQIPHRVVQTPSEPDLRAIFQTSIFSFVIQPQFLLIEHRGLEDADEHRRRSQRPPRHS